MLRTSRRIIREARRIRRQAADRIFRALGRRSRGAAGAAEPPAAGERTADADPTFAVRKARKLERIRSLLDLGLPCVEDGRFFDFLTGELRREFAIVDTDNVSSHDYDRHALQFIDDYADGLILDCGAGLRRVYYDNVVNFEICPYDTTDVRGVGERLPFRDGVFDAVFSFAVLEHVKDPFACAREISRVLKPGGRLYCVVPFLQPFHAYPHHYYNMSHMGLKNLFADALDVELQEVNAGGRPIFTLTWMLQQWLAGLPPAARRQMKKMRVADLARSPFELWDEPFVTELKEEKNFELASTTSLFARKPAA
jgi:SAM-dependent methyltransferase